MHCVQIMITSERKTLKKKHTISVRINFTDNQAQANQKIKQSTDNIVRGIIFYLLVTGQQWSSHTRPYIFDGDANLETGLRRKLGAWQGRSLCRLQCYDWNCSWKLHRTHRAGFCLKKAIWWTWYQQKFSNIIVAGINDRVKGRDRRPATRTRVNARKVTHVRRTIIGSRDVRRRYTPSIVKRFFRILRYPRIK